MTTIEQFYREQGKMEDKIEKLIQLKQVLDNKRFLLFTIFIPVAWYVLLYTS